MTRRVGEAEPSLGRFEIAATIHVERRQLQSKGGCRPVVPAIRCRRVAGVESRSPAMGIAESDLRRALYEPDIRE
jgi:hypothetical protein